MRDTITTFGELVGAALITNGVWSYSSSLGKITAGALLAVVCWLASS